MNEPNESKDPCTQTSGYFTAASDASLYYRKWSSKSAKEPFVIMHGAGEHSGRYSHVAARLNEEGFCVYAFDLSGHGCSSGKRGHIRRFDDYIDELAAFVNFVTKNSNGKTPILLGHSLGGLIATYYAARLPNTIRCLVLSSPLWAINIPVPLWKKLLSHWLSGLLPSLTLNRPTSSGQVLSHDPEVERCYRQDPLVHFKASLRLYAELQRRFEELVPTVEKIRLPILVLQAGDDRVASCQATERVFPAVGSMRKKLIVYDGYYHEIFNEVGKEAVFHDLLEWLRTSLREFDSHPRDNVLA